MKRPYLAPKDGGGSDHVVSVDLGRAPWEQSRPESRVPKRSSLPPKPAKKPKDPWAAPVLEQEVNTSLKLDPGASAESYSKEESRSFWSLPSIPAITTAPEPTLRPLSDEDSLSGSGEEFDTATGWTFPAIEEPSDLAVILDMPDDLRSQPVLPSVDELFSGELPSVAWSRPPTAPGAKIPTRPAGATTTGRHRISGAPRTTGPHPRTTTGSHPPVAARTTGQHRAAPGGADVDALLTRAREHLSSGEVATAMKLLGRARRQDPTNNSVATWLEFAQRRLLREHLPDVKPESVPTLTAPRNELAAKASGLEKQLIAAIDGKRTLGRLLAASNDDALETMLKMFAAFTTRGWIAWA